MIPIANLEESEKSVQQHHSACQGLGTPDSLLPPSEPPNIQNWFSSYEYESLVLETNDNFGFSDHQESQGYREESNMVEISRDFIRGGINDGLMKKKTTSSMLIKCNQSEEDNKCEDQCLNQVSDLPNSPVLSPEPPGIEKWFSSYAYESPPLDTIKDVILCDDKESMMECCNGKIKRKDLICNQSLEGQRVKEVDNDYSRKEESTFGNVEIKVKNEIKANGDSWEDDGNGFVSMKNKREDDEKWMYGNGGRGKNELKKRVSSSSSSSCVVDGNKNMKKDERVKRKTLGDVTNIEMTGKWKCPRKGKPEIGPPLKQLRLGQWFHQV